MKHAASIALLLVGLFAGMAAGAKVSDVTDPDLPRSLPAQGPVSVQWTDPVQFSEIRDSLNRTESRRGDWVRQVAEYLRTAAAKRLQPGQHLDVTITDIKRAGAYEPWQGINAQSIRFMRDIYPPRLTLDFILTGADGQILAQGTRKLSDMGYLSKGIVASDSDPLRYEKRLIDDWLRKELPAPAK